MLGLSSQLNDGPTEVAVGVGVFVGVTVLVGVGVFVGVTVITIIDCLVQNYQYLLR